MQHSLLVHEADDHVGVAVVDLCEGAEAHSVTLSGQAAGTVKVVQDIPLGHKVAMRDIQQGEDVVEYGRPIGRASEPIACGAHVHTHNLRSLRW